jgi:hypothetical protein
MYVCMYVYLCLYEHVCLPVRLVLSRLVIYSIYLSGILNQHGPAADVSATASPWPGAQTPGGPAPVRARGSAPQRPPLMQHPVLGARCRQRKTNSNDPKMNPKPPLPSKEGNGGWFDWRSAWCLTREQSALALEHQPPRRRVGSLCWWRIRGGEILGIPLPFLGENSDQTI